MSSEAKNNVTLFQPPSVSITGISVSLQDLIMSRVISDDWQNSSAVNMDSMCQSMFNSIIIQRWETLKKQAPQDLKEKMVKVEQTVLEADQTALFEIILQSIDKQDLKELIKEAPDEIKGLLQNGISQQEDPPTEKLILKAKANLLFQKLTQKFEARAFYGNLIPVNLESYLHLQAELQQALDHALLVLWDGILITLGARAPLPKTPTEIRAWLTDPTNKQLLDEINILDLRNKELKVIPPEILFITELRNLYLDNNQITSIPAELAGLKLKRLDLNDNQVTNIPVELADSNITWLELNNNQVTSIPVELAESQLTFLLLHNNQITSIPAELAESKLEALGLDNNQITNIPAELAKSKLLGLYLDNNQITNVPAELAESKLEELYLNNNQITSIPVEFAKSKLKLISVILGEDAPFVGGI